MKRSLSRGLLLALLLSLLPLAVLAAPVQQDGGGIHFGAYTLQPDNRVAGDLVVMGGPVDLGDGSELDGDLTVFGPLTMGTGAVVEGQLVVLGSADVAGRVEGDVFTAGVLTLGESAYVEGDVSVAGPLELAEGAVIEGDVTRMDEEGWELPEGVEIPGPWRNPEIIERTVEVNRTPRWVTYFWNLVKGIAGVVLLSLLALVLTSLWPTHIERISRVVEEAPLPAFGVGFLTLLLSGLAAVLLAITICLSPFALVGMVVVGVGALVGWAALGLVLGRRILSGLSSGSAPATVTAAVVGTALVSFILALSRVFGGLNAFLIFLLVPPGVGAVVLTRFGTQPYATRGTGGSTSPRTPPPGGPKPGPGSPTPVASPPQEAAPSEITEDRHDMPILPQGDEYEDASPGGESDVSPVGEAEPEMVLEIA